MAVGSHGYFRGTVADGTPAVADVYEDFNPVWAEIEDPDAVYSINGTNVRVAETGRYFVRYNIRVTQNTSNDRLTVGARLRINTTVYEGSETEVYNRNTNNPHSTNSWAGIISLTADDDLDLQYRRASNNITMTTTPANECEIQIVRVPDSGSTAHSYYSDSAETATFAGTTYLDVDWNTIEEETDTAVIQRNADGEGIDLKGAIGDRFLVCVNTNFNAGSAGRSQRACRLTLDGTELTGTSASLYIRNNNNPRGSLQLVTLVEKTSASTETLMFQMRTGAIGDSEDGTLNRTINESGFWIMKLPSGTESCRFHDATGGQNIALTDNLELNIFNTSDWTDSASFVRLDAQTLEVQKTNVYLFGANVKSLGGAGGTRLNNICSWEVNQVRQIQGKNHLLTRNNLNFVGAFNTVGIFDLTANDDVDLESEKFGQGGENDTTVSNEVGGWAINLATLLANKETFEVNALLQETFDETFIVDARVGVFIKEFIVDSLLQDTFTKTFIVDALLQTQNINKEFIVDSVLVKRALFEVDSILVGTKKTFTVDAKLTGIRVQRGTVSFTGLSTDVTLSAIVLSDSFLIFQYNADSPDVDEVNLRGQITSPTNIHFERTDSGSTIDLSWYVVEDGTRISSQRGSLTMASTTENQTIASVDTTKAFSLASWENPGASWGDGDTIRHRLTSATNLEFLIDTLPVTFEPTIDWEVVEYTGAVVQRGITTFSSVTASEDIPITSVDLSRSIVHLSNTINGAIAVTPDIQGLSGELTTSTNLHIERDATGNSMQIAWEVTEFPTGVKVQSGVESLGTTQTVANVTINPVDLNASAVLISHHMKGGRTNDSVDDNPHTVWYKAELTTQTNLQLTRASNSTGDVSWFVIQFSPLEIKTKTFTINALLKAQGDNGNCGARIQTAVATLAIGVTSLAVTIDPVVMTGSFLIFNQNEAGTDTNQFNVLGEITNSTTLTFTRKANAGTDIEVSICWYVVEYPESVSVQRGINVMATATVNQTITAVDISRSFPIQSFQNDGILWGADDAVRARLTSSTNLELMSTLAITDNLAWQVIEYTGASVQRGLVTFASGGLTSTDITITAVDRTRSFAIVTASKSATSTPANAGLTAELTTDTNLHIERASNSGNAQDIAWFVIEMPPNTTVQFGTEILGTTQTVANIAINPIKQDNTISFLSHNFKGGRGGEAVDQDPSTIWYTSELTTPTNLRLTRGLSSGSTSDVSWFVVEFGPLQHACTLVDARLSPLEEFEVDAILQATFDEEFIVDALLQATFDKTFEVDACLMQVFIEEFEVDALLQATFDETFLVDALLQATFIEEFIVDAIIKQIVDKEFIVDAVLQATFDKEFIVDAVLKATFIEEFEVDALLQATFIEEFEVDAFIKAFGQLFNFIVDAMLSVENQKLFIVDSILQATFEQDFIVDAIVVNRFDEEFIVDAIVVNRFIEEFLVDALLQATFIEEFIVDVLLSLEREHDFFVDALLQATFIEEFIVDAVLQATFIEEFEVDALIQRQNINKEFTVNALLQATFIEEFLVNAVLQATFIEEFIVDAVLQATFIEEFRVDAFIQRQNINKEFIVDAVIIELNIKTFVVGKLLKAEQTFDFLVDAFILEEQMEMFIVDGILQATFEEEFIVDGILKGTIEEEFIVDAVLKTTFDEEFEVNALLQATFIEEFLVDALLEKTNDEEFIVDGIVQATFEEEFIVDAVLEEVFEEEFIVDGITKTVQIKEFTVNAVLQATFDEEFEVNARLAQRETFVVDARLVREVKTDLDAVLKATIDEEFTVDAITKLPNSTIILVDGLVTFEQEEEFIVDAVLAERKTHDFFVNALLAVQANEEEFTVNALLAEVKIKEFTVNARLVAIAMEEEFQVNALILMTGDVLCAGSGVKFSDSIPNATGWTTNFTFPLQQVFVDQPIAPGKIRLDCFNSRLYTDNQAVKSLGTTIQSLNEDIIWEFEHLHLNTCSGFRANIHFSLTETNTIANDISQGRISLRTISLGSVTRVRAEVFDSAGNFAVTTGIFNLVVGQTYHPRISIENGGTLLKLEYFADSSRTASLFINTVSTAGVNNEPLSFIQVSPVGGGGSARRAREEFDDILVSTSQCPRIALDAFLKQVDQEQEFIVDAILGASPIKEFIVDGIVQAPLNEEDFFVNAVLKKLGQELDFIVDGNVGLLSQEEDFFVNAILAGFGFEKEFQVDALLKAFDQIFNFLVNGIIFKVPSTLIQANALLTLLDQEKDFFVDAKVAFVEIEEFIVDAQLKAIATIDKEFQVDGLLPNPAQIKEFTVNALIILLDQEEEFFVHAIVKALDQERESIVDAHIRLIGIEEFIVDAQLEANVPETTTIEVNAIIGFSTEFTVNALLKALNQEHEFIVDAKIVRDVVTSVNAFIKRLGDNCALGEVFQDNIPSNTGWDVVNVSGVQIRVDGGFFPKQIQYDSMGEFLANRLNKLIDQGQGGIVQIDSDSEIRLDFKYKHTGASGDGDGGMLMGITDVNDKIMNQKRFGVRTRQIGGQFQIRLQFTDGIQLRETSWLDLTLNQDAFITANKVGSDIFLELFSDPERTVGAGGSPTALVDTTGLNQVIFDHMGGSGNDVATGAIEIDGLLDNISLSTRICVDVAVDGNLAGGKIEEFEVNALLVREVQFALGAFIKAIGDVRCLPSFTEKIFEDDLDDNSNWSIEINSTTVDGWDTERIFIDGEDPISQDGSNGFVWASMPPGGFSGGDTPVFKSKYRRKLISSEGGIGRVRGANFRMEFELHQTVGGEGVWIGLNRTGFHPENDPNTSTFQVNSGNGEISATLSDGVNSVTTLPLSWIPVGEESPDPLFIVVESFGGFLTLNAYNDAEHTIHNGSSPVTVGTGTIEKEELGMEWLFVGANSKFSSPTEQTPIATIDNILIYSDPCPIIRVDAQLKEFFSKEFTVNALLTRRIQFEVDAKLRGRKDFTVNAVLVRFKEFQVNAILDIPIIFEFFVNGILKELKLEIESFVNAILARTVAFTVGAIFSTQASDPNFSESHMLDIVPMFNIDILEFIVDGITAGRKTFLVDAKLSTRKFFDLDAVLSTEPQILIFSSTHLQDITQIFSIAQPQFEFFVNALIKEFDNDTQFRVNASLTLRFDEEFNVNAILVSVTKIVETIVSPLLKEFNQEQEFFADAKLVDRFIEEFIADGLVQNIFNIVQPKVNALLKAFNQDTQFRINVILVVEREFEFRVDAIIKRLGDNGICNVFPEPFEVGTGLSPFFQTPITPAHEENVDLFIGQEFTLSNQQIRSMTLLLRASGVPNQITSPDPSVIQGKIWANVVEGQPAGEVVIATSDNSLDARATEGDLPAGDWKEVKFTFDRATSPFITGTFLVGFEHFVANEVASPEGVAVARPVINNGNAIAGEALFRRSANSGFADPTVWQELVGSELDIVINIELVNGNEIIVGESKQCPVIDASIQAQDQEHEFITDAQLIPRRIDIWDVSALLQAQDQEEEFIVNAILAGTETFQVDARLFAIGVNDEEFIVNGILLLTTIIPTKVSARLVLIDDNLETFDVNGFRLAQNQEQEFFADVFIKALDQEEDFFVNSILRATFTEEPEVNAILKAFNQEEEFDVNAILIVRKGTDFFVNALLKLELFSFRVDAFLSQFEQRETKVSAVLTDQPEQDFFVNVILTNLGVEEEFFVNSILQATFEEEFRVDAQLSEDNEGEFFVSALLSQDSQEEEFFINALLNKSQKFQVDALKVSLGSDGNNGSTNALAVNPFIDQNQSVTGVPVPVGTNLCGQRLRLPTSPVRIISFRFRMFRDGLSGSPVGTLEGRIYRNSIVGNPISAGDLLDTSDNIVPLSDLTTNVLGDNVVFNFSTVEITPDDNIFVGIQITGTNEEVFFNVEGLGTVIEGGDFTTESSGNWGVDTGVDANMQITIDDEPRQRASAIMGALVGVFEQSFIVDGTTKADNQEEAFRVSATLIVRKDTGDAFKIGAILIGSVDLIIGAFVGEVQETVLDVESVVVTNNSDSGIESTLGGGEQ